jgi:hypothetical protein
MGDGGRLLTQEVDDFRIRLTFRVGVHVGFVWLFGVWVQCGLLKEKIMADAN